MGVEQRLQFEAHGFIGGCFAFVRMIEIAQGLVVVLGCKEFTTFNTQSLGDLQGLMGHPTIEPEQRFQFIRWQEVPEGNFPPQAFLVGMVGDDLGFDVRIHAAIDTADPLHESDRIPMQVVIDQPRSVLQVETF